MVFTGSIVYGLVTSRGDAVKSQPPTIAAAAKGKEKEKEPIRERSVPRTVVKTEPDHHVKLEDEGGETVMDVMAEAKRRQALRRENGGQIGNGSPQRRRPKEE